MYIHRYIYIYRERETYRYRHGHNGASSLGVLDGDNKRGLRAIYCCCVFICSRLFMSIVASGVC